MDIGKMDTESDDKRFHIIEETKADRKPGWISRASTIENIDLQLPPSQKEPTPNGSAVKLKKSVKYGPKPPRSDKKNLSTQANKIQQREAEKRDSSNFEK
jgi:hypothetical protein